MDRIALAPEPERPATQGDPPGPQQPRRFALEELARISEREHVGRNGLFDRPADLALDGRAKFVACGHQRLAKSPDTPQAFAHRAPRPFWLRPSAGPDLFGDRSHAPSLNYENDCSIPYF